MTRAACPFETLRLWATLPEETHDGYRDDAARGDGLGADEIGVSLTEHGAMLPAASVAGLYFGHRESRYFAVGRVGRDQVEDYARRKEVTVGEAERWLAQNLAYEPA